MERVFSQKDIEDFERIEQEIEQDQAAFLRVADNLIEVRDRQLYGIVSESFEDYVKTRWGWSRQRAYQLIRAKEVVQSLPEECKQVVYTEAQARALAPVPPKRRMRVILDAQKAAPNGVPNARHIAEAAQRAAPPSPPPAQKPEVKDVLLDKTGWQVPDDLVPLFERAPEVTEYLRQLSAMRGMLKRVQENKDVLWAPVNFSSAGMDIDRVYAELKQAVPWVVCPSCQGRKDTRSHCGTCKGRGVISQFLWDNAIPEELKAVRQKSCKK